MNGQIRGCPIQKTHVIVQPRNFDPIQKTHVKGGAAQLWGGPELIAHSLVIVANGVGAREREK